MSKIQVLPIRADAKFPVRKLQFRSVGAIVSLVLISLLFSNQTAHAHHALGGRTPANFFEGFLSGLAHPVIGLDHLAFVVAIGLISAGFVGGAFIPAGFVIAAMAGTGIHLNGLNIPGAEIAIATSVIAFGAMLVMPNKPNWAVLIVIGAIAGLFHGYAYGEAIFGAGMTPLVAYLLGFTVIQYVVALIARTIGNMLISQSANQNLPGKIRLAGSAICGMGFVFLTNSLIG